MYPNKRYFFVFVLMKMNIFRFVSDENDNFSFCIFRRRTFWWTLTRTWRSLVSTVSKSMISQKGAPTPKEGVNLLQIFYRKLHEIERILTRGSPSLAPSFWIRHWLSSRRLGCHTGQQEGLPHWPARGQQVSHQRWIWGIHNFKAHSHLTCAFASNVKNGFYGNRRWCIYLTFAFSRPWRQRSKKNANVTLRVNKALGHETRNQGDPLELWNPAQMSPEVQDRGIRGPTKRTYALKNLKNTLSSERILLVGWPLCTS